MQNVDLIYSFMANKSKQSSSSVKTYCMKATSFASSAHAGVSPVTGAMKPLQFLNKVVRAGVRSDSALIPLANGHVIDMLTV